MVDEQDWRVVVRKEQVLLWKLTWALDTFDVQMALALFDAWSDLASDS